jgi:hypothetical protein
MVSAGGRYRDMGSAAGPFACHYGHQWAHSTNCADALNASKLSIPQQKPLVRRRQRLGWAHRF